MPPPHELLAKPFPCPRRYSKDQRYSVECVSTHDRQQMKALSATTLTPLEGDMAGATVIGIDEVRHRA